MLNRVKFGQVKCMVLSERQKQILFSTVKTYISTGEPVGSKMLCEIMPVQISSATVRAELSALCEMGFLAQPHTSAGRVPTAMGYRYYIERLRDEHLPGAAYRRKIDDTIGRLASSTESVLEAACEALARLTGCAAVVTAPSDRAATLKAVKLIKIGARTVMTVIMTSTGLIKNRVVRLDGAVSDAQLEKAARAIDECIIGHKLSDISIVSSQDIICKLGGDILLLAPVVSEVVEAVISAVESELMTKGESNLLCSASIPTSQAIRLYQMLRDRASMMDLLLRPFAGLTLMLGRETGYDEFDHSGVIATEYELETGGGGVIGIIGPERMDYDRIVPAVMYVKDSIGRLLCDSSFDVDF